MAYLPAVLVAALLAPAAAMSRAEALVADTRLAVARVGDGVVGASQADVAAGANPIRRVVKLLQGLAEKVAAEGEKEEKLYAKFHCYCQASGGDLAKSIAESTAKLPQVQADIEASGSELKQLQLELASHQEDRTAAKAAVDAAAAQREREHKEFAETSGEYKSYIDSLAAAIPAVQKGMAGTLVQTGAGGARVHQAIAADASVTEYDRRLVMSFLAGGGADSEGYVPRSGEIVGILEQIKEDFEKSLAEVTSAENSAVNIYEELVAAKTRQIAALSASIEKKTVRIGELQVNIANLKGELTQEEAALVEDQKFAADLEKNCKAKSTEWEERKKVRAEELVAIHETIKILNSDDALDLFKKALPSPSLLQVGASDKKLARKALGIVRGVRSHQLDFLALALAGKQVDFTKVIGMIDDMVALLAKEQTDDEHKKQYCEKQLDLVEDQAKQLAKNVDDLDASISDKDEAIKNLAAEIKELTDGIAMLDKSVAEATEQRKNEHVEYVDSMQLSTSAKELLEYAKKRLNKFYNPTLTEATESTSGEAPASLVQVSLSRDAPSAAPETWGAYEAKSSETSGVISHLDLLIKDLVREMTVAETEEKASQKQYEETMDDAAKKRAADLKTVAAKEMSKSEYEVDKAAQESSAKMEAKELQAAKMYEMQLHKECDWLMQNFDLRKQARADETEALHQAKAILKGADFALVQRQAAQGAPAPRSLRGNL